MHLITRENSADAPYGALNDPAQHQVGPDLPICQAGTGLPMRYWVKEARDARPKSDHER